MVNDNLFILNIDKNKVDPYYILAFLKSYKTKDLIKSRLTRSNNLSIKVLNNLDLDFYDSYKRGEIKNKLIDNLDSTKKAYEEIERFEENLANIF